MPLNPVRIVKTWFRNKFVEEQHWDELVNKYGTAWTEALANFKQLGLDLGGPTYDFNNVGKATQTSNVVGRVDALEKSSLVGFSNLGIDISTPTTVGLVDKDGAALSTTNLGRVVINETSNAGQLSIFDVSVAQSVTLTGAHFGFGTEGDLTDQVIWIVLIDDAGTMRLGLTPNGGLQSVASADCKTVATDATARTHILCASAVSGASNVVYMGWVKADFDDTGGASEDLWTIQSSQGDVNLGPVVTYAEVSGLVF